MFGQFFWNFIPKIVSNKTHSAENPIESPVLTKCFVSSKIEEGFNENKLEKSHRVPKNACLKKYENRI